MYYSYVEIEYVATSFSPTRMDLALKLLKLRVYKLDKPWVITIPCFSVRFERAIYQTNQSYERWPSAAFSVLPILATPELSKSHPKSCKLYFVTRSCVVM
jgi:hypothetical protein